MKNLALPASLFMLAFAACSGPDTPQQATDAPQPEPQQALQVYSARHYDSDAVMYARFEDATGIRIEVREGNSDQLLETMKAEGDNSPADLIIASDAGALWRFQNAGLTQPYQSNTLEQQIPASMRQADGQWFGLSNRVRLVAYDPDRVTEDQVDDWMDLADPALKGEICVRSSSNIYNLSLMAELIARYGQDEARNWATGVVANMARQPQGGDTDQIRAIAAGQCSVAIVNHYYWARLAGSTLEKDRDVAAATKLTIPSFADGGGSHVNISGIAIAATADDADLAARFIEFVLTEEGQNLLTLETREMPLAKLGTLDLPTGEQLSYTLSDTPLETFGKNQAEAQRIYDEAGWN